MPRGCGPAEFPHSTLSVPFCPTTSSLSLVSESLLFQAPPFIYVSGLCLSAKHYSVNIRGKGKEKRHRAQREQEREKGNFFFKKGVDARHGGGGVVRAQGNEDPGSGVGSQH